MVFDAFYFIINFGSFFASLLIPPLLKSGHARWAFGVPAILMALSTVVLFLGRKKYVHVPPAGKDPNGFLSVCTTALFKGGGLNSGSVLVIVGSLGALGSLFLWQALGLVATACLAIVIFLGFAGAGVWLRVENARGSHPDEDVDGVKAVLRVLVIFALVTPFWSLFDQKASTWILQAKSMQLPGWGWFTTASQMQALNPLLVMLLIPFNNLVLYPGLKKRGVEPTALRRMGLGIAFSGLAWIVVGSLQLAIDAGQALPILWQILPYALLTFGEVLVSATGLEFAYSQAPQRMKGVLMSFWSLSVTIGNLWVLLVNASVKNDTVTKSITDQGWGVVATQMYFFAGFAFVAAGAFALYARKYTVVDNYRKTEAT